MNDSIVLPGGIKGILARQTLRRHIRALAQVQYPDTDILCERVLCQELIRKGRIDISFAGEATDMRRAFVAIARLLGQWPR